jgi:hypothetical protein
VKKIIFLIAALYSQTNTAFAVPVTHTNQQVMTIRTQNWCDGAFFTLQGVSQAHAAFPNIPWFHINRAKPGANDMIAVLMTAKATGRTVNVYASDVTFCGGPEVSYIDLN